MLYLWFSNFLIESSFLDFSLPHSITNLLPPKNKHKAKVPQIAGQFLKLSQEIKQLPCSPITYWQHTIYFKI